MADITAKLLRTSGKDRLGMMEWQEGLTELRRHRKGRRVFPQKESRRRSRTRRPAKGASPRSAVTTSVGGCRDQRQQRFRRKSAIVGKIADTAPQLATDPLADLKARSGLKEQRHRLATDRRKHQIGRQSVLNPAAR